MIGKVTAGKSFAGCVRYVVQKLGAVVLDSDGIRTDAVASMVADFNLQRKLNPELEKAVGHISLSWSVHDKAKLSDKVMVERAREYMERMQITSTQYLIVQHKDREHLHIVYKYRRGSEQLQCVSFRMGELSFKGSGIDRSLSYVAISKQVNAVAATAAAFTWPQAAKERARC
ncbi:relaxase/mobilization nuclease domain-containing protein [Pontibacter sp. JH31]|uniref:Relaxase/mobilization nuclease domain-containing protein n=1 Tax=Pontibacter aquaedesilientis TaxID=2766980 RepID=A0ABR7XKI9_9BACT|nr:relaxase/mobilization nuclease domain-containing protein [Pontibacter aquaedesilientis]MBD1398799.1 relaxase/mobilization nuclease domain-containing protein [Pontibacter aquaedesilientis]